MWFVCLFDICAFRMANSVRALYKPTLQGLAEEVFIVAVPITAFPVLSLTCTINTNMGALHLRSGVWVS